MTTKANRNRAAKRIEDAKRKYGLAPGFGAAILRLVAEIAYSPWSLRIAIIGLFAYIYLIL
jgi:hypothetical protein